MAMILSVLVCVLSLFHLCQAAAGNDVVVTIITHNSQRHIVMATEKQQLWSSNEDGLRVVLSSELYTDGEPWTIVPLLWPLAQMYPNVTWYMFVTEWTQLNVERLYSTLTTYDPQKELFIGHSLEDQESTIPHHYNTPHSLSYPLLHSGVILSAPALHRLIGILDKFDPSFNIDSSYEFSQFLKYLHTPSFDELYPNPSPPPLNALLLTHEPMLCSTHLTSQCTTGYSLHTHCGRVELERVFFAVKTCTQYHSKRLPVVQGTWAADLSDHSIGYYSDSQDDQYHTIDIGVPNTERGHCGKMEAILRLFEHAHKDRDWLIIADDDTLLSVPRLLELLSCYDHTHPLILGEVYGYSAHVGGTNYITGGGSMVVSVAAVKSFIASGRKCPSLDYPDDMFLGSIATTLGWEIVHSPLFHQSQPRSYPKVLLDGQRAVSFHRHTPSNPYTVYTEYLMDHSRDRTEL